MSAIQLLEKLGASVMPLTQKQELASSVPEISERDSQLWCLMFPEKDEDDTEKQDDKEKTQIDLH